MEKIFIKREQISNKGQTVTSKAIIDFMLPNFSDEVKLTVFSQENPTFPKVPAQLNTYLGHKMIGTYDKNIDLFEVTGIEEEDISEIITHAKQSQWKNPYSS